MIVPGSANPLLFSADDGYNLTRSLRFRSSASAYLNRTPASASNRTTWTWSAWVKRGKIGSGYYFLMDVNSGVAGASRGYITYNSDVIDIEFNSTGSAWDVALVTSAVYRDPSAWYHLIVACDTTQATSSNRLKLYVNGSQVTAFSAANYPSLNSTLAFNMAAAHYIGKPNIGSDYLDGYLTEINFIDGQALTPSSFGETDLTTGVWKPKRYAGTYGTNGFYLPFQTSNSDNIIIYYPGTLSGSSVINVEGSTNGTKGSGVSSATGKVGTGLQFDGTINGYVDSGVSTNYTTAFSTALWVKTTSTNTQFLVSKGSYYAVNTSDFPFHLSMNPSGSISAALDSGNGDYNTDLFITSSTTGYNDGNWHHVVFTFTSSIAKIYVDGTEVASSSTGFSLSTTTHNWFLGRAAYPYSGGSPGNPYTGTLDDFRLYSRALTSAEASAIYSGVNTQVGIGSDASGNVNHWTPVNISLAPGVTDDSMTDVPTLTSATAANFAVLNPLDNGGLTITNGNLNASRGSGSSWVTAKSTIGVASGKWYWEFTSTVNQSAGGPNQAIGISKASSPLNTYLGSDANSWSYFQNNGNKWTNNTGSAYGSSWASGDVIGVALDVDNGTLTFYKNNVSQGTAFTGLTSGFYFPSVSMENGSAGAINFGQRPFTYTPPTGYVALNTYNLPTSTIVKGNTVMDATLYTGNGSTQTITNAAGFKPDLVWMKDRSQAYEGAIFDSVRGTGLTKSLTPSSTRAESGNTTDFNLTSFNSNGFSLDSTSGANPLNRTSDAYVGWQWQAGQGTTSTNTNGSITSTVSVNASAGFSIATFSATGSNATIGHGLGVAPSLVILKDRATVNRWLVYHSALGATQALYMDLSNAATTSSTFWNNTAPTSSTVSIGTWSYSGNQVMHCWTPIAGFSAFGSYVGNGSSDGTFVYTGFRPKFVMMKRATGVGNWFMYDTARSNYNLASLFLYANLSDAESSDTATGIDMLSNGFKLRVTGNYNPNTNGETFIYMAFAENPFKNSLAR